MLTIKNLAEGMGHKWHTFSLALLPFLDIMAYDSLYTFVGKRTSLSAEHIQFSHLPLLLTLSVNPSFPSGQLKC